MYQQSADEFVLGISERDMNFLSLTKRMSERLLRSACRFVSAPAGPSSVRSALKYPQSVFFDWAVLI
jgi:hypothetical protein